MIVFRLIVGVLMCLVVLGFGLFLAEIQSPMTQTLAMAIKLLAGLGIVATLMEYHGELQKNGY